MINAQPCTHRRNLQAAPPDGERNTRRVSAVSAVFIGVPDESDEFESGIAAVAYRLISLMSYCHLPMDYAA
jgi:hypothetical protein